MQLFLLLFSFSLFANDWIQCKEGLFTEWEPLDLVEAFVGKEPVIFEAGAHYGDDSKVFAIKWPKATIYSFEANPHAFEIMQKETSPFPNVIPVPLAVNDVSSKIPFFVSHGGKNDPIFEGSSSLLEPSDWMANDYAGPVIEIEATNLDEWCQKNNIDGFDFLWLDLEGLELRIAMSSPEVLKKAKVIYTETNFLEFRKGTAQFDELKQFLESSGFKMLTHWYAKHKEWYQMSDGKFQGNALFVKKELFNEIVPSIDGFSQELHLPDLD